MRLCLLLIFCLSFQCFARLIQDEVTGQKTLSLSLKEACELHGFRDLPLIEIMKDDQIDCMGKMVTALSACLKKEEKLFLKASISEKKVFCTYGTQVILGISCDERDTHYCNDSKKSCMELSKKFAYGLELMNHSIVDRGNEKGLSCLFDRPSKI